MIYSERAGVQYFPIPKVACTSIKLALLQADGYDAPNGEAIHSHPRWRGHGPKEWRPDLRFTFVRHPFDRLASAYRQKLQTGIAHRNFGCPLEAGATMDEWVDWVTGQDPDQADAHWRPQTLVLGPTDCDYLGRLESVDVDWDHIRRDRPLGALPHENFTPAGRIYEYSARAQRQLARFYGGDLDRFEYETVRTYHASPVEAAVPPGAAPNGHLFDHEYEELQRLASGARVLEVGAWQGRSTVALASTALSVVTVDHFCGDSYLGPLEPETAKQRWQKNIARHGLEDRCRLELGDFREVLARLDPADFDLYFYDADHTGEATESGLVFGREIPVVVVHDYKPANPRYRGAIAAIDRFTQETERTFRRVGSLAILELQ